MRSFRPASTQLKPTSCQNIQTPHNGQALATWKFKPSSLLPLQIQLLGYTLLVVLWYKTRVFDTNLQRQLLLEYKRKSKIKSEECPKFVAEEKALITIIVGQCDEATKTKLLLEQLSQWIAKQDILSSSSSRGSASQFAKSHIP